MVLLWFSSTDFQQRVDRSLQMFDGSQSAIDFALADRLPIWNTAINMYQDHPINGVGARAFRMVYAEYAEPGDVWVEQQGSGLHAHHWVLELLSETGSIGLLLMLLMCVLIYRHVRLVFNHHTVWPYATALLAAMLPGGFAVFVVFFVLVDLFVGGCW